jgi:hypothetical protein
LTWHDDAGDVIIATISPGNISAYLNFADSYRKRAGID